MANGTIPTYNQRAITLNAFQNGWTTNGLCFYKQTGNVVHLHVSMRNGTTTDGTVIAAFPVLAPSAVCIAPIFNIVNKVLNGYVSINTSGSVTISGVSNASYVMFDLFWQIP